MNGNVKLVVFKIRQSRRRFGTAPYDDVIVMRGLHRRTEPVEVEIREIPETGEEGRVGRRVGHHASLPLPVEKDVQDVRVRVAHYAHLDDVLPREGVNAAVRVVTGHAFFGDIHVGVRH